MNHTLSCTCTPCAKSVSLVRSFNTKSPPLRLTLDFFKRRLFRTTCPVFGQPFTWTTQGPWSPTIDALSPGFHDREHASLISDYANRIKSNAKPEQVIQVGLSVRRIALPVPRPPEAKQRLSTATLNALFTEGLKACSCCRHVFGLASFQSARVSGKLRHGLFNTCRRCLAFFKCSTRTKLRAKKKGLPHSITGAYLKSIWPEDSRCPIFGTLMHSYSGSLDNDSAALDRIVPTLGYVPGNVWWISTLANNVKSDATWRDILKVGLWYDARAAEAGLEALNKERRDEVCKILETI